MVRITFGSPFGDFVRLAFGVDNTESTVTDAKGVFFT
jgi:hypothetical protein